MLGKKMKMLVIGGELMMGVLGLTALGNTEVWAADCDDGVETSILGGSDNCYEDDGEGGGIYYILNIILTVLTYGVGIAGTIGLVVVGIMYASAGGNESQMAKAKTRILEIVIGLVAYAVLYAALQWLIPGGLF